MALKSNTPHKKSLSKKESLAVAIPMFNEEKVGGICIDKVMDTLKNFSFSAKLIVVNDGSTDKTEKILLEKKKKYFKKLIVVTHKKNRGYGSATQSGIKEAIRGNFTWILHMDSDLTNDPKYIKDFWGARSTTIDCIKASRYIKKGKVQNVPQFRRIISLVGNTLASILFGVGIYDCTNGFRMVRLAKLKGTKFHENNFSIILEELYYLKKKNARFTEIPYTLTVRKTSASHFHYKPKIFYDYFKYAFKSFFVF